jgi:hypothetical protein
VVDRTGRLSLVVPSRHRSSATDAQRPEEAQSLLHRRPGDDDEDEADERQQLRQEMDGGSHRPCQRGDGRTRRDDGELTNSAAAAAAATDDDDYTATDDVMQRSSTNAVIRSTQLQHPQTTTSASVENDDCNDDERCGNVSAADDDFGVMQRLLDNEMTSSVRLVETTSGFQPPPSKIFASGADDDDDDEDDFNGETQRCSRRRPPLATHGGRLWPISMVRRWFEEAASSMSVGRRSNTSLCMNDLRRRKLRAAAGNRVDRCCGGSAPRGADRKSSDEPQGVQTAGLYGGGVVRRPTGCCFAAGVTGAADSRESLHWTLTPSGAVGEGEGGLGGGGGGGNDPVRTSPSHCHSTSIQFQTPNVISVVSSDAISTTRLINSGPVVGDSSSDTIRTTIECVASTSQQHQAHHLNQLLPLRDEQLQQLHALNATAIVVGDVNSRTDDGQQSTADDGICLSSLSDVTEKIDARGATSAGRVNESSIAFIDEDDDAK